MPESCRCHEEIARLHHFFQEWFRGNLEPDAFASCEEALAQDFTILTPSGEQIEREQILEAIRGHRGGEPPHFEIDTAPRSCKQVRGLHIATYEEHQSGTRSTVRVATAIIDGSMKWRHIHETWLTTTRF